MFSRLRLHAKRLWLGRFAVHLAHAGPTHYSENITRLQLYRSTDDWNMDLLDEVPVSESIYDANRFEVTVDSAAGTVSVALNGTERLVAKGIMNICIRAYYVLLRPRYGEFSDFKVEGSK